MFTFVTGLAMGSIIGGVACALSARTLGWFNKVKQDVETKVGIAPKP